MACQHVQNIRSTARVRHGPFPRRFSVLSRIWRHRLVTPHNNTQHNDTHHKITQHYSKQQHTTQYNIIAKKRTQQHTTLQNIMAHKKRQHDTTHSSIFNATECIRILIFTKLYLFFPFLFLQFLFTLIA